MTRQDQIALAARASVTPGGAGDPRVHIGGYGRTFDPDHGGHLSVTLIYADRPDDEPVSLRITPEEWRAALVVAMGGD